MCGSDLNNCEEGFSCVWDGQDNDVGICKSTYGNAKMTDISIWCKFRVVNYKNYIKSSDILYIILSGSQAKMVISGSDGYNYPNITITFSDGTVSDVIITEESDTFPPEEGDLCYLNGVVAGQIGSRVKLIGCIQTEERHESDQMTIILYAALDSGWYSVYYATEQDDFLTVKKIRQKNNVEGKLVS